MKASLKASLETAIDAWLDKACDHKDRPEGYVTKELSEQMANAAACVWDANFSGQETMKREDAVNGI